MKFSVQLDNIKMLDEALESSCDGLRYGSEFCEWKIPTLDMLRQVYTLTNDRGKEFTYVTPKVSDVSLERVRRQLAYLDSRGEVCVVANDLGLLSILGEYPNLKPHMGRQLVTVPARCPWPQITQYGAGFLETRQVAKIFYQTSLNYEPTIQLCKKYGVQGADMDWIPPCFQHLDFLVENGLSLSIHVHLVPVTMTRRCHTARFLGEEEPEECSRPCYTRAFLLRQKTLGQELFLHGNVVFRLTQPSEKDVNKLYESKVDELIITMNPITKIENRREVDDLIQRLTP